ncbi:MAG TPA: response regulator transcription factor [Dissulfurispiraceae bacterium]|nr:response regulator transcription factor [Dissulfurispiraceae bacterium]
MIRVLVADDHTIVRKGLKQLISEHPDMEVTGEARNGPEALSEVMEKDYDMVLLDLSMPGRGGIETIKELKALRPKLSILVLTMHPEEEYAIRALKAGASGYLTKESAPEELITAMRKVAAGSRYISMKLAEELAFAFGGDIEKAPHELLSDREFQIMIMIGSGKTVKDIAAELSLSMQTVSTYRARILTKMKMRNNAELTLYAIRHHLVR